MPSRSTGDLGNQHFRYLQTGITRYKKRKTACKEQAPQTANQNKTYLTATKNGFGTSHSVKSLVVCHNQVYWYIHCNIPSCGPDYW